MSSYTTKQLEDKIDRLKDRIYELEDRLEEVERLSHKQPDMKEMLKDAMKLIREADEKSRISSTARAPTRRVIRRPLNTTGIRSTARC
jgi:predicted nuclease with TOPRIM domain